VRDDVGLREPVAPEELGSVAGPADVKLAEREVDQPVTADGRLQHQKDLLAQTERADPGNDHAFVADRAARLPYHQRSRASGTLEDLRGRNGDLRLDSAPGSRRLSIVVTTPRTITCDFATRTSSGGML